MVKVRQMLVSPDKYDIKCPNSMTAEYITIHNTANDASADDEVSYMISNDNEVSFHYAVDDVEVVQGILTNRNAWHAGDGNGTGNRKSIGVEICYSESGGERYEESEENAVQFVAQLLKERGWGTEKVKQHNHWSGKNCPHRIRAKGDWQSFLERIDEALGDVGAAPPQQTTPSQTEAPKPTLKKGSKGEEVKKLQSILGGLTVDGDFGSKTEAALKEWQKAYGLTADGIYGEKSEKKMQEMLDGEEHSASQVAPKPTLKKGSKGEEVKKLQSILGGLKVDGDFGSKTEAVLKEWQKAYGLTADGIYGEKSEAKMQAMLDGEANPVYEPKSKVTYRVYTNGKWYGWIEGYNTTDANGYVGVVGSQIMGVQIQGDVEYRVRTTDGKWWSWIKGYNTTNSNGYAGTLNKPIDAIQIKNKTYRVSPVKSNYLGWITHYNTTDGNGYAGIYGKAIDRLQIQ